MQADARERHADERDAGRLPSPTPTPSDKHHPHHRRQPHRDHPHHPLRPACCASCTITKTSDAKSANWMRATGTTCASCFHRPTARSAAACAARSPRRPPPPLAAERPQRRVARDERLVRRVKLLLGARRRGDKRPDAPARVAPRARSRPRAPILARMRAASASYEHCARPRSMSSRRASERARLRLERATRGDAGPGAAAARPTAPRRLRRLAPIAAVSASPSPRPPASSCGVRLRPSRRPAAREELVGRPADADAADARARARARS